MDLSPIVLIVSFVAFFLALSVHEFAHAMAAYYLGDTTAQQVGRLTLNPIAHIDLFGTILLPLFLILSNAGIVVGWAKPVPVNYYNLRDQRWGPALVSIAGPAANLIFGIIAGFLLVLVNKYTVLASENLLILFLYYLTMINIVLMVFNLIPVPPLDGSKLLFALLPPRYDNIKMFLHSYGLFILLLLLIVGIGFVFVISQAIFIYIIRFAELLI